MARVIVLLCSMACAVAILPVTAAHGGDSAALARAGAKAKKAPARRKARCVGRLHRKRTRKRDRCPPRRRALRRRPLAAQPPQQDPRPVAPLSGPTLGCVPASGAASSSLSVSASEWRLQLSRPSLTSGNVTVELRNRGEDAHNLVIRSDEGSRSVAAAFSDTPPGGRETQSLSLAPGRYYMFCALPGHESAGMHACLTVQ